MSDRLIWILLLIAATPGAIVLLAGVIALFKSTGRPNRDDHDSA